MSDNVDTADLQDNIYESLGYISTRRRVYHRHHDGTTSMTVVDRLDRTSHPFDDSLTDPSFAHPASALANALRSGKALGSAAAGFYDFPDGKDTGQELPISRKIGADLAEISQEQLALEQSAKSKQSADAALSADVTDRLKALQTAIAASGASEEGGSGEN